MERSSGVVALFVVFFALFLLYMFLQKRIKDRENRWKNVNKEPLLGSAQQEVPNISSSVNGISTDSLTRQQPPGSPPLPYSSIVLGDKDMRPGFDDPPPSYEQAMNSLQTQRIDSEVRINVTDLPATSSEVHVPVHRPEVTS